MFYVMEHFCCLMLTFNRNLWIFYTCLDTLSRGLRRRPWRCSQRRTRWWRAWWSVRSRSSRCGWRTSRRRPLASPPLTLPRNFTVTPDIMWLVSTRYLCMDRELKNRHYPASSFDEATWMMMELVGETRKLRITLIIKISWSCLCCLCLSLPSLIYPSIILPCLAQ